MGHGIHQFDMLLAVLGPWRRLSAFAARQALPTDTEDVSMAVVDVRERRTGDRVNSIVSPRESSRLRFDFEYATVEVEHVYGYTDADWPFTPAPGHEHLAAAWAGGRAPMSEQPPAADFRHPRRPRRGRQPPVGVEDARRTLEFAAATYASAFRGAPVSGGDIVDARPVPDEHGRRHRARGRPSRRHYDPFDQPRRRHRFRRHDDDDVELFRYTYVPDTAQLESPKPYLHPIRTASGHLVSLFRPHDHVWHKGIAWSLPVVGDENFWGGPTYVRDQGYVQLPNDGAQVHVRVDAVEVDADGSADSSTTSSGSPRAGRACSPSVARSARASSTTTAGR